MFGLVEDRCQRRCGGLAVVYFPSGQKPLESMQQHDFRVCADSYVYVRVINAPVNPMQVADEIVGVCGLFESSNDALYCDVRFPVGPRSYE